MLLIKTILQQIKITSLKNAGDIATNKTNIAKNAGDIADNKTAINKNAGDIATNKADIAKIKTTLIKYNSYRS